MLRIRTQWLRKDEKVKIKSNSRADAAGALGPNTALSIDSLARADLVSSSCFWIEMMIGMKPKENTYPKICNDLFGRGRDKFFETLVCDWMGASVDQIVYVLFARSELLLHNPARARDASPDRVRFYRVAILDAIISFRKC